MRSSRCSSVCVSRVRDFQQHRAFAGHRMDLFDVRKLRQLQQLPRDGPTGGIDVNERQQRPANACAVQRCHRRLDDAILLQALRPFVHGRRGQMQQPAKLGVSPRSVFGEQGQQLAVGCVEGGGCGLRLGKAVSEVIGGSSWLWPVWSNRSNPATPPAIPCASLCRSASLATHRRNDFRADIHARPAAS